MRAPCRNIIFVALAQIGVTKVETWSEEIVGKAGWAVYHYCPIQDQIVVGGINEFIRRQRNFDCAECCFRNAQPWDMDGIDCFY